MRVHYIAPKSQTTNYRESVTLRITTDVATHKTKAWVTTSVSQPCPTKYLRDWLPGWLGECWYISDETSGSQQDKTILVSWVLGLFNKTTINYLESQSGFVGTALLFWPISSVVSRTFISWLNISQHRLLIFVHSFIHILFPNDWRTAMENRVIYVEIIWLNFQMLFCFQNQM
jgi:hypothetical protein